MSKMVDDMIDPHKIPSLDDNHYYVFHKAVNSDTTSDAIKFILQRNIMPIQPKCMKMIINSPGGSVAASFALTDTMLGSKVPIYTYGLGMIASCGLMMFIAGTKGHRYITRNTMILSHQYSSGSYGKDHELMASMKMFDCTRENIVHHYQKCTGMSEKNIKKYLLPPEDVWLTADEAIKYGIADKIVDFY